MWIFNMSDEMIKTVSREIKEFYLGDKEANETLIQEVMNVSANNILVTFCLYWYLLDTHHIIRYLYVLIWIEE